MTSDDADAHIAEMDKLGRGHPMASHDFLKSMKDMIWADNRHALQTFAR